MYFSECTYTLSWMDHTNVHRAWLRHEGWKLNYYMIWLYDITCCLHHTCFVKKWYQEHQGMLNGHCMEWHIGHSLKWLNVTLARSAIHKELFIKTIREMMTIYYSTGRKYLRAKNCKRGELSSIFCLFLYHIIVITISYFRRQVPHFFTWGEWV